MIAWSWVTLFCRLVNGWLAMDISPLTIEATSIELVDVTEGLSVLVVAVVDAIDTLSH